MNDAFTRRGFTRLALFSTAGLFVPRLGAAQDLLRLSARFAIEPGETGLALRLFLDNRERRGVELLAGALRLDGTLAKGRREPVMMAFESRMVERRARSRMGFRVGATIAIAPAEETVYDVFHAPWPAGIAGGGTATLELRARLAVALEDRPADEHAGLRALAAIRAPLTVTLPA